MSQSGQTGFFEGIGQRFGNLVNALDLGGVFIAAGDTFTVGFVAGNGFSFHNFTVTPVPEPTAQLVFLLGLALVSNRVRWRS